MGIEQHHDAAMMPVTRLLWQRDRFGQIDLSPRGEPNESGQRQHPVNSQQSTINGARSEPKDTSTEARR